MGGSIFERVRGCSAGSSTSSPGASATSCAQSQNAPVARAGPRPRGRGADRARDGEGARLERRARARRVPVVRCLAVGGGGRCCNAPRQAEGRVRDGLQGGGGRWVPALLAIDRAPPARPCSSIDADGRRRRPRLREFRSTSRSPAGSSTTPRRSGERPCAATRRRSRRPACRRRPSRRSASRTSARPRCSGTARPASRSHRAIVWQDRRTAARVRRAARPTGRGRGARADRARPRSVFLRNEGRVDARARAGRPRARPRHGELAFGTIDSWLIWKLTGGARARDRRDERVAHDALRHPTTRAWDDELLRLFGVPRACCRRCVRRAGVFGARRRRARAARRHPDRGHRRRSAGRAVRAGVLRARQAKNTYGTGCFLLINTGERAVRSASAGCSRRSRGGRERRGRTYALEGAHLHRRRGGAVAARRARHHRRRPPRSRRSRASVPDTGGVYSCRRSPGSARRYWDPTRAARIVGLTRGTTRAHLARAALEAIAFQTATWSRRWRATPAARAPCCASTAARPRTSCSCSSRPTARRPRWSGRGDRDHRARRRLPRRARRGTVAFPARARCRTTHRACVHPAAPPSMA